MILLHYTYLTAGHLLRFRLILQNIWWWFYYEVSISPKTIWLVPKRNQDPSSRNSVDHIRAVWLNIVLLTAGDLVESCDSIWWEQRSRRQKQVWTSVLWHRDGNPVSDVPLLLLFFFLCFILLFPHSILSLSFLHLKEQEGTFLELQVCDCKCDPRVPVKQTWLSIWGPGISQESDPQTECVLLCLSVVPRVCSASIFSRFASFGGEFTLITSIFRLFVCFQFVFVDKK